MTSFKRRLIAAAWTEYSLWTGTNGRVWETNARVTGRQQAYWAAVGRNYTAVQIQDPTNHVGPNAWMAWSAAFISYLFQAVGAGPQWTYAVNHVAYVRQAKKDALKDTAAFPFQAHPVSMLPVQVGDVLCNWRTQRTTWTDIDPDEDHHIRLHCDLVVDVNGNRATVMGGNMGAPGSRGRGVTVNTRSRALDMGGRATLASAVALIKNYK